MAENPYVGDYFIEALADALTKRLKNINTRKRVYNIDEAAEYLGMSEETVRDLVGAGKLQSIRPTRKLQFDIQDIDAFIDGLKKKGRGDEHT